MALINCSECGAEVSDKAASCPKCGAPITAAKEVEKVGVQVQTIQETSKKLKLQALISGLVFIIGMVWLIGAPKTPGSFNPAPVIVMLGGLVWFIVIRIKTWWHHK